MASNFTNFIVSLVDDPQKLDTLKRDPDVVLKVSSLTPAEKSLIKSGDMQMIRSAIVADPDHKEAMGISSEQSLPARMPMIVYP
jgi:hypothetical protein